MPVWGEPRWMCGAWLGARSQPPASPGASDPGRPLWGAAVGLTASSGTARPVGRLAGESLNSEPHAGTVPRPPLTRQPAPTGPGAP